MMRVEAKPGLLRWARERAGFGAGSPTLVRRFPKLAAWERGEARPTLKQFEEFAKAVHVPVGFLFFQEPPIERVPVPDFRTAANVLLGACPQGVVRRWRPPYGFSRCRV